MKKQKQEEIITKELSQNGVVRNVYAFEHHILRLSSIIRRLRRKGWNIRTNTEHSNTSYELISMPIDIE